MITAAHAYPNIVTVSPYPETAAFFPQMNKFYQKNVTFSPRQRYSHRKMTSQGAAAHISRGQKIPVITGINDPGALQFFLLPMTLSDD
jgi:hypothetical protein